MNERKMNSWNVVNEQIQRSKIRRFPWEEIFGKTLKETITECKNKGWNSQFTKEYLFSRVELRRYILDNQTRVEKSVF